MGLKFLATVLWASLSLTGHVSLAQSSGSPALSPEAPNLATLSEPSDSRLMELMAQWLLAIGLLTGAIAISVGVYRYNQNEKWYRIEFLRKTVKEFEQDADIWKALKILDFEEYRDHEIQHAGELITFRVNNELLCRALATHAQRKIYQEQIEKKKVEIEQKTKTNGSDDEIAKHYQAALKQYQIETELRDWFNKMLNGLEHFGYFVESGMFTANEMRPWMIYWIRLIADRQYKRQDASKFYDQLYTYIHAYGFSGVIRLFESFGYRILPTPYKETDFSTLKIAPEAEMNELEMLQNALSLAKAAYLVYQNKSYIEEISYQRWQVERGSLRYFDCQERDTQVCVFKTPHVVVVAFRGSQETKDWQTNFRTRLRKVAVKATTMEPLNEDWTPPRGQVHRGFQSAWEGVEDRVIKRLRQWNLDQPSPLPLLITGHSLGGALATVAAASLVKRGFNVQGLYTFGQPRVGDLIFVREIGQLLKGKVFRFVNNNDVVPHVPPPYLPWNPTRLYTHMGQMLYFNARGTFIKHTDPVVRLLDFAIGLLRASFEPGLDLVNDHRMEFYISNLENAVKIEQEKQTLDNELEDDD
ncbi:lipase family protein [Oculatella sp. LEGE 06141]|uniref:lipase family protein n=1 Tax=Oculatella sp. LEGE 06141 TaxID=1828648 RepID=UPI0018802C64|nr:lipase family protein [Oculatella sp. LEGE 06141]MBE9179894.1 lipase family protein [Oculatella sp. LEGE 06141]